MHALRSTLLTLTLLGTPALALQDDNAADTGLGTWFLNVTFDGAPVPMTLTLSQAQSGLVGTLERGASLWKLSSVHLHASDLTFDVGGVALAFRGRIEDGELAGSFTTPFGKVACTGSRGRAEPWAAVFGSWKMDSDFNGQSITATLRLARNESGDVQGVWESMGRKMPLSNLSFDGRTLSFVRSMGGSGQLTFTGKVEGDRITAVQSGAMGDIPCKGVRAAEDHDDADADTPANSPAEESAADAAADQDGPLDREAWLDKLEADYKANGHRAVPRDAFHVFNNPKMTPAAKSSTVQLDEPVVGVFIGGQAKAYPISTLKHSELINDMCGGVPIAASW